MQKIAQSRADPMSRFHNALYAGDVISRISVLRDVGLCKCAISYIISLALIVDKRSVGIFNGPNEWDA